MTTSTQDPDLRLGLTGAAVNIAGILLSGPLGVALVALIHPNPAWQSPRLWAENFHPVQTLPFYGGFLLLGGYLLMMSAAHRIADEKYKGATLVALLFTAAFATLIFFNYFSQTTFLPALAQNYSPEYDAFITSFSLNSPQSLCWAIEMWGYALLGAATCFAAPVFNRSRTEKITAGLMVANGVLSIAGGFVTAADLSWVLSVPGLVSYILWNGLVLGMAVFFWVSLKQRGEVSRN